MQFGSVSALSSAEDPFNGLLWNIVCASSWMVEGALY
jgi:hypothetical protein